MDLRARTACWCLAISVSDSRNWAVSSAFNVYGLTSCAPCATRAVFTSALLVRH